jgi:hypothetical protein
MIAGGLWMRCVAELFTETTVFFDDTSFVSMDLERNGYALDDTIGYDSFAFCGAILPGRRVAATGRACRHEMTDMTCGSGLGGLSVPCGRQAICVLEGSDDLSLRVKTNLTLDAGRFTKDFAIRLGFDGVGLEVPLSRPDVKIEWSGRGEYLIPLQPFLDEVLRRRLTVA